MANIKGNIKEDEREAFELICERKGKTPDDAKGVGYLNRLTKLCSITGLSITLDYGIGENGKFTVHNVPEANNAPVEEEVVPPAEVKKEYVAPESMNLTDADTDDDEQEEDQDDSDPFED